MQAALKKKSDKFRLETDFAAMTSAIGAQNEKQAQNGPMADLSVQMITDLLRTRCCILHEGTGLISCLVCDMPSEIFSVSIHRRFPKVNTIVQVAK